LTKKDFETSEAALWGHIYGEKKEEEQSCKMGCWLAGPKKQVQMEFETAIWTTPNVLKKVQKMGC
jgi:hypothetical protein